MSTLICPACARQALTSGEAGAPAFCPFCGASLFTDGDESETRPVQPDEMPTQSVPPGAVVLAAYTPDAEPEADWKSLGGDTRDLPAAQAPFQDAPGAPSPGAPDKPGNTGRSIMQGVGIVALVVLLLAIVAAAAYAVNGGFSTGSSANGGAPTATATLPRPTATVSAKTYSPAGLYQITYPLLWNATQQNDPPQTYNVTLVDPQDGASMSITAQQASAYVDPSVNDLNYLNSLGVSTNSSPQNLSAYQAITLAGATWTQLSGNVKEATANGGVQYAHAVVITTNHNGYVYTIVRQAPVLDPANEASTFDAAEQAAFQPMLATFRFLS